MLEVCNGQQERPEGTVGGKVWTIARKHTKDGIYQREPFYAECKKAGINDGTVNAAMVKYCKLYAVKADAPAPKEKPAKKEAAKPVEVKAAA